MSNLSSSLGCHQLAKLVMVHTRIQEQTKEISARLVALRIDTDLSQEEAAEVAILQVRWVKGEDSTRLTTAIWCVKI